MTINLEAKLLKVGDPVQINGHGPVAKIIDLEQDQAVVQYANGAKQRFYTLQHLRLVEAPAPKLQKVRPGVVRRLP